MSGGWSTDIRNIGRQIFKDTGSENGWLEQDENKTNPAFDRWKLGHSLRAIV